MVGTSSLGRSSRGGALAVVVTQWAVFLAAGVLPSFRLFIGPAHAMPAVVEGEEDTTTERTSHSSGGGLDEGGQQRDEEEYVVLNNHVDQQQARAFLAPTSINYQEAEGEGPFAGPPPWDWEPEELPVPPQEDEEILDRTGCTEGDYNVVDHDLDRRDEQEPPGDESRSVLANEMWRAGFADWEQTTPLLEILARTQLPTADQCHVLLAADVPSLPFPQNLGENRDEGLVFNEPPRLELDADTENRMNHLEFVQRRIDTQPRPVKVTDVAYQVTQESFVVKRPAILENVEELPEFAARIYLGLRNWLSEGGVVHRGFRAQSRIIANYDEVGDDLLGLAVAVTPTPGSDEQESCTALITIFGMGENEVVVELQRFAGDVVGFGHFARAVKQRWGIFE